MPPISSDDIRADFVQFWLARGGHLQPSSSLIPYNDPTVLLTTAGMQQFVPYMLGKERPPYRRYVSVQKCFRTSDIDEVGDRSHLTFFEMLGNFSIGDYFKAEVIPWALEFSTRNLGLDRERLWITIHESDDEANEIWLETGLAQERILRFGDEHNASCITPRALASSAVFPKIRPTAIAGASNSGTSYSCSSTRTKTACVRRCRPGTWTRAWAWSAPRS